MFELNKMYGGVPYEDYSRHSNEIKALRSSHFKHLRKSARHLKIAMEEKDEACDAMNFGSLVHSLFENPWRFMDLHKVEPIFEGRTQKGELTRSANCKEVKEKRLHWLSKLPKDAIIV